MLVSAVLLAPRLHNIPYLEFRRDESQGVFCTVQFLSRSTQQCAAGADVHLGCWRRGDTGDAALLFFFFTPLAVALPIASFRAAAALFGEAFALAGLRIWPRAICCPPKSAVDDHMQWHRSAGGGADGHKFDTGIMWIRTCWPLRISELRCQAHLRLTAARAPRHCTHNLATIINRGDAAACRPALAMSTVDGRMCNNTATVQCFTMALYNGSHLDARPPPNDSALPPSSSLLITSICNI